MGSNKKIGLSHEMGLIDTPPLLPSFLLDFALFLGDLCHLFEQIERHKNE